MIPRDEARRTLEFENHYVIQPEFKFWSRRSSENRGTEVPDDFEYNSDNNPWRLTIEEMRKIIKEL
jgi:UDP-N-acetylglucosamine 4,6-dehydratase